MAAITPFITFNDQADEAVKLYTSLFKNARIISENRYGEGGPMPAGTLMTAELELEGQRFIVMNGGPTFSFSDGISLFVSVDTQDEVDHLWERLTEGGGQPGPCGWLKDKFGVSWQIIPKALTELMSDEDPRKAGSVVQAMLKMSKIDIAGLQRAYDEA